MNCLINFLLSLDIEKTLWYVVFIKNGREFMQRKLLTNGNAFKRTDGRWCGAVWYMDEHGERKRKSFSGTTKQAVNRKMTDYVADFENQITESDESKKTLVCSMQNWLKVFKFPSVEPTTYDRCECSAKYQIYPLLGENGGRYYGG